MKVILLMLLVAGAAVCSIAPDSWDQWRADSRIAREEARRARYHAREEVRRATREARRQIYESRLAMRREKLEFLREMRRQRLEVHQEVRDAFRSR
jgi:hypothetical protein